MHFLVAAGMYRDKGALLRTIETGVKENPLSFATSRMVTIGFLSLRAALRRNLPPLELWQILADTTAESATSVKHTNYGSVGRATPAESQGSPCDSGECERSLEKSREMVHPKAKKQEGNGNRRTLRQRAARPVMLPVTIPVGETL